jgi:hypothetical protein
MPDLREPPVWVRIARFMCAGRSALMHSPQSMVPPHMRAARSTGPTKPFSCADEAGLKPRSAAITSIQQWGEIMLITILNAIYREFLRTSLSGAKVAGA